MYFPNTHTPAHLQRIIVAYVVRSVSSGLLNAKTRMVANFHSFVHFTNTHTFPLTSKELLLHMLDELLIAH